MEIGIKVTADFSGGLDLVFDGKQSICLEMPTGANVAALISKLSSQHANRKKEMFSINDKIRPGILVLINDCDWELSEKQATMLSDKDKISFISTLHGG